jgi:hypothetical protein
MKSAFCLFVCICSSALVFSQSGGVRIHDYAGAQDLVEKHKYFNREHSQVPGWRIQVHSTPSMNEAKQEKSKLLRYSADLNATIVFEAPNYKLRVGNYRNRFDAYRDMQDLLIAYPDAFICKDLVNVKGQ